MLKKAVKHLITITKHKWKVFLLCYKCGIPFRGLIHDLSKYSPTEFFESIKYYHGDRSPNGYAKEDKGYSESWLHHKGRNKHHHQYWYDYETFNQTPMMPYKYVVEMICDDLAAGMTYNMKKWTNKTQLDYWMKRKDKYIMNDNLKDMLTEVYKQVSINGTKKTVNKNNLIMLYNKYCK